MAIVRLQNGKGFELSPEKGIAVWKVLQGEIEGTEQQQAFCETIREIYLDRHNPDCPASYLEARKHIHERMDKLTPRKGIPWSSKQ